MTKSDTVRLVRDAPLPTPAVTQPPGHCDLTESNARKLDEMLGQITGTDHPTTEDLRQHNERKLQDHKVTL